ncbi:MAG TPA: response regulator transcription factor [Flavipsychrobacter sp.]
MQKTVSATPISVVIADDHELFRDGLKLMLSSADDVHLAGEAWDGRELINQVKKLQPDVVITDIKMPITDGVEATKFIMQHYPVIKVIALSMYDDEELILEMFEAGAIGYLLKNADKSEVIEAIQSVYQNKPYYCKSTSGKLTKLLAFSRYNMQKQQKEAEFTEKEKEIIRLICQEYTNKQIGEKLYLSTRTVEGYRMKILEKMGAKNIVGIVIEAIRLGIYTPQS